jgi:hypothetical protein
VSESEGNMGRREDISTLQALKGRTCIYKEKQFIRHVVVTEVDVDERGVRLSFEVLPTPGFGTDWGPRFDVSASWEVLGVSERAIGASYVSWLVVIRPDLVKEITVFAAAAHDDHELMRWVNKVAHGTEDK